MAGEWYGGHKTRTEQWEFEVDTMSFIDTSSRGASRYGDIVEDPRPKALTTNRSRGTDLRREILFSSFWWSIPPVGEGHCHKALLVMPRE